jgi:hypothetical protein
MLSIENTKTRLKNLVDLYKKECEAEYIAVCDYIKENRSILKDEFASTDSDNAIKRSLYEIPETLSMAIVKNLDTDELTWLATKEGGIWFAKTFKEFRVAEKL